MSVQQFSFLLRYQLAGFRKKKMIRFLPVWGFWCQHTVSLFLC
ncbi:unnamed protein product [Cuscuta europaea]|uniref:Uncharacterized protein n=1 Tax=Cuscuta europaea TaxID=41803 RepID=A0A9P1E0K2_CUSEU|nr:unnamed protein product [Cuscuta europaea]